MAEVQNFAKSYDLEFHHFNTLKTCQSGYYTSGNYLKKVVVFRWYYANGGRFRALRRDVYWEILGRDYHQEDHVPFIN